MAIIKIWIGLLDNVYIFYSWMMSVNTLSQFSPNFLKEKKRTKYFSFWLICRLFDDVYRNENRIARKFKQSNHSLNLVQSAFCGEIRHKFHVKSMFWIAISVSNGLLICHSQRVIIESNLTRMGTPEIQVVTWCAHMHNIRIRIR